MQRRPRRGLIIDKLHKGFVLTCVAVTIYGSAVLALKGYRYYTEVKPQRQQKLLLDSKELLAEGSSDNLKDHATSLNT